ncbi:MAG: hypothetical protein ACI8WB_004664 [Phenylobacterium sp.]|jgi:hypothetical protein
MMMQYHSGQVQQAQVTGKKLFDKLNLYYQQNADSFKFWGLGNFYLIAKFHCGQQCQLPDDLQQAHQQDNQQDKFKSLFKSDHAFWMDDIAFTRVALSPWAVDPEVVEYLARIEQDGGCDATFDWCFDCPNIVSPSKLSINKQPAPLMFIHPVMSLSHLLIHCDVAIKASLTRTAVLLSQRA